MAVGSIMEKTVAAFQARREFGKLLQLVAGRKDRIIVQWHGQPMAALVPMEVYEQWRAERDRAFVLMEEAATRANLTKKEAGELAREAIAAVRATRRP